MSIHVRSSIYTILVSVLMHLHDMGRGFVDCKVGLKHAVDHMDPEMKTLP